MNHIFRTFGTMSVSSAITHFPDLYYLQKQIMSKPTLSNTKLLIEDYTQIRRVTTNLNEIVIDFYDNNINVGFVQYYINTGQIGMIMVHKPYRNKGLGKQIISDAIHQIKVSNRFNSQFNNEVWLIASKTHDVWTNIYKGKFSYRNPIQPNLLNGGFYMKV